MSLQFLSFLACSNSDNSSDTNSSAEVDSSLNGSQHNVISSGNFSKDSGLFIEKVQSVPNSGVSTPSRIGSVLECSTPGSAQLEFDTVSGGAAPGNYSGSSLANTLESLGSKITKGYTNDEINLRSNTSPNDTVSTSLPSSTPLTPCSAGSPPLIPSAGSVPLTPTSAGSVPLTPSSATFTPFTPPSAASEHEGSVIIGPLSNAETVSPVVYSRLTPMTPSEQSVRGQFSPNSPAGFSTPQTPLSSPSSSACCLSPSRDYSAPESSGKPASMVLNGHGELPSAVSIERQLSFASLSSGDPQAVYVMWVESPHNFVVSCFASLLLLLLYA